MGIDCGVSEIRGVSVVLKQEGMDESRLRLEKGWWWISGSMSRESGEFLDVSE